MAGTCGVHRITLKAGVDEAEFERFAVEEMAPAFSSIPGLTWRFLKGERGDRAGKYLVLWEVESVEMRDLYFPVAGEGGAEEFERLEEELQPVPQRWAEMVASFSDPSFTDYLVLSEK